MNMARQIEPETLDHLAVDDPRAMRSRRDLQRVNRVMGSLGLLVAAIDTALERARPPLDQRPLSIAEIGTGDGTLALRLARERAESWPRVSLVLVDRQPLVSPATGKERGRLGGDARCETADVFDWIATQAGKRHDLVFTNLFLHHFEPVSL